METMLAYRVLLGCLLTQSLLVLATNDTNKVNSVDGKTSTFEELLPAVNLTQLTSNYTTTAFADISLTILDCKNYTSTGDYCGFCKDKFLVWYPIEAGETARQPCPSSGSPHLPTLRGSVSRYCDVNGTWAAKANFDECIDELLEYEDLLKKGAKLNKNATFIYLGGFILSNIAMIIAVVIFLAYKHLRCLRNLIHSQLFIAITMKNIVWIAVMHGTLNDKLLEKIIECKTLFTLHKFFYLSQFSWIFIEGLYLFIVVVGASLTDQLKFKHCTLIGWGLPTLITLACIIVNVLTAEDPCWHSGNFFEPANAIESVTITIFLAICAIFMIGVIYTLVRKLRNSALNERKQYGKALKALTVLVPLLGGTYLLIIVRPTDRHGYTIWVYINSIVQSTVGFVVALVYCFLNEEVRSSLTKSYRHWQDEQTLPSHGPWSRKRRSSSVIKKDETETETTTCQYSSRRNSRRVSEDTVSSSRRGSHIPDVLLPIDLNANKSRKLSPLALRQTPEKKDVNFTTQPTQVTATQNNIINAVTQLSQKLDMPDCGALV